MLKRQFAGLMALVLALTVAGSVLAQDLAPAKSQCSIRSADGVIRVIVCPPGLDMQALRLAGEEACGMSKMCNAWIWDKAEKAPKNIPSKDSDIKREDAGNAIAVWANDVKRLMLIKRVDN